MIHIHRITPAPSVLKKLGPPQTKFDCDAYEDNPEEYRSGRLKFSDNRHYSKKAVKDVLRRMHHDKCCYCETKQYTPAYLHVEHFRPKGAVRQSRAQDNEFPGYYWLAYCWDNLLLACFECNVTYKNTMFPLANPTQRAQSHNDDITREQELFVNPIAEDPRGHIRFDEDLPVWQTERGHQTIEELGLRRSALTEERLHWFQIVKRHIDIVKVPPSPDIEGLQDEARRFIEQALQPYSKFSSMVMDLVARREL